MTDRIISIIGGIVMIGLVTSVSLENPCNIDGQIVLAPDVVIEYSDRKICFEMESDYQNFKNNILTRYKANLVLTDPDKIGRFDTKEDQVFFLATINEELKRGNIDFEQIKEAISTGDESIFKAEMNIFLNNEGIVKVPDNVTLPNK